MSSTEIQDGAAVRFPPPFVPVIGLVLGILLNVWAFPLAAGLQGAGVIRWGLGSLLTIAGLALLLAAAGLFRSTGQDPKPWVSTPEIISNGVYGFTRNPMYLGMGVLQAGIGVLLANAWVVILVPATWLTIYWIAIRHEEAYLEKKFGSAYHDYKISVRRWL